MFLALCYRSVFILPLIMGNNREYRGDLWGNEGLDVVNVMGIGWYIRMIFPLFLFSCFRMWIIIVLEKFACFMGKICTCVSVYITDTHKWGTFIEMEILLSCWWIFQHWLHWKLSKWQFPVQPVMKISSKWQHFHYNVFVIYCQPLWMTSSAKQHGYHGEPVQIGR